MKKIITIIILLCLYNTNSFSQVKWGVLAGVNMSNISTETTMRVKDVGPINDFYWDFAALDEEEGPNHKFGGIRFGISADIKLSNTLTLNTGLIYSEKGYLLEIDYLFSAYDLSGTIEANTTFKYFDIPLDI